MDRAYFQLIDSCTEAVRLSTAIARNVNYNEAIRNATDPIIVDACKEVERLRRTLHEILNRQKLAYDQSMSG